MNPAPDPLLTLPEIAQRLRVSVETARRLVRRREITAINVGASNAAYRVRSSEVDRFLAARTIPALQHAVVLRSAKRTAS